MALRQLVGLVVVLLVAATSGCSGVEGPVGPQGPVGPEGPAGPQGAVGAMGAPGAFPAMVATKSGNNGTVSCTVYCSDLTNTWPAAGPSGTCVGVKIVLGAGSKVSPNLNGYHLGCEQVASSTVADWSGSTDAVSCLCLRF